MDLKEISIFSKLSNQELEKMKSKTQFEERIYRKDDHIFMVGEVSTDMYYLIEGSILVYKLDSNGKRYIIRKFNKAAILGEVYSYLEEPFDFFAQAERDSKVLVIHDFKRLFSLDAPEKFFLSYINLLSKKCLSLSRANQTISQSTLRQKIAKDLLLREREDIIHMDISREEWADTLATTRPSLSRELSNMIYDNLIDIKEKTIKILDKDRLKDII